LGDLARCKEVFLDGLILGFSGAHNFTITDRAVGVEKRASWFFI
jgi:hypothetical protein